MHCGKSFVSILGVALLCSLVATNARADDDYKRIVFFSGADFSTISEFTWAGADVSFASSYTSAPLLRVMGGVGAYDYDAERAPDGKVIGSVTMGEALAGWRHLVGPYSITLLAGVGFEEHKIDVEDPNNKVQGSQTGVKIAADFFWRPTPASHVEASASYTTSFDSYRARLAAGHTIWRGMVAGLESEAFGNAGSDQVRAGVFISEIGRGRWRAKASTGFLHDREQAGGYARFGVDFKL